MADTPDWLQVDDKNNNKEGAETLSPSSPPSSPFMDDDDDDAAARTCGCSSRQIGAVTLNVISFIFLDIFIYSAIVQDDDDKLLWFLYYSLHAALAALFLLARLCNWNTTWFVRSLLLSVVCMSGFATFMMWTSVTDYQNVVDKTNANTNNDGDREDTVYKMGGAAVGGLSVLYHVLIWECGSSGGKQNDKDDNDADEEFAM